MLGRIVLEHLCQRGRRVKALLALATQFSVSIILDMSIILRIIYYRR